MGSAIVAFFVLVFLTVIVFFIFGWLLIEFLKYWGNTRG